MLRRFRECVIRQRSGAGSVDVPPTGYTARLNSDGLTAQGKSAMNAAIGHCMSKALAILWGVWCSGRDFDPTLGAPRA